MSLPKSLYRSDDNEEFTLNEDGETYSIEWLKKEFPGSLYMEYSYEDLMRNGFSATYVDLLPPPRVPNKFMWEILVPTSKKWEDGSTRPIHTRHHKVWDAKVREISGGLTITSPAKGEWISDSGELFREKMIPVRILCTKEQIEKIIEFTLEYYAQEAVLAYKISEECLIRKKKNA